MFSLPRTCIRPPARTTVSPEPKEAERQGRHLTMGMDTIARRVRLKTVSGLVLGGISRVQHHSQREKEKRTS
jgi:hypothetical protein